MLIAYASLAHVRTSTHRSLRSAILVLVAQWLEHLTGDHKVVALVGSILIWDSEMFLAWKTVYLTQCRIFF